MKFHLHHFSGLIISNLFFFLSLILVICNYFLYRCLLPDELNKSLEINNINTITAVVISYPHMNWNFQDYQVRYPYSSKDVVLRLRTGLNNKFGVGDRLNITGRISSTISSYDYSKGISGVIWYPQISLLSRGEGPLSVIYSFRNQILEKIYQRWHGAQASLMAGLLFGADLPYSSELKNDFKLSGTLHLIAVSGFNINFVGNGIMKLSIFLGRKKTSILTMFILFSYYLLVGWESIPCLRAFIMYSFDAIGKILGRRSGVFQSLGFSLLIIMTIWPYSLFNISLQLSFLASFGLIILQIICKRFNIIHNKWHINAFMTSLSCSIATLPILMQLGNIPSYRSLIANTMTSPLIIYTVLLGIFTLVSEVLFGLRIDALVMLTDLILQTLIFFISFTAQL